jgi:hypothetical protein
MVLLTRRLAGDAGSRGWPALRVRETDPFSDGVTAVAANLGSAVTSFIRHQKTFGPRTSLSLGAPGRRIKCKGEVKTCT